jgi:hypothetical protein
MVALQCLVVMGVDVGTILPACGTSDQCHQAGTYCSVGSLDRCAFCGNDHALPLQTDPATGGALNDALAPDFAGYNLTAVTQLCADPRLAHDYSAGRWSGVSSVISWCKFGNGAVDRFTPGAFT